MKKGFKKIISNAGYLFGEKIITLLLGLFVSIWVARYLGPNDFGLWRYAESLIGLVMALATLGTTQIVIRDLVDNPEKEGEILGTAFSLMLGGGIVTAVLIVIVGFWLNNDFLTRVLIIIASTNLIFQAFTVFDYWFQAKVLSKYSVFARTSAQIISSLLKIVFILFGLGVIYFSFTIVIIGLTHAIVWFYFYNRMSDSVSFQQWHIDFEYAKSLLKDSWPLILTGLSVAVYMKIDQVMIKDILDADAVGNYAVAAKVSELWYFIPLSIASSVFPSIIKSKKDSVEKYYQRLQYLYDVLGGVGIYIAIPMTFLSSYVILLLFGSEYEQAAPVLSIHIWSGIFVFLGVARSRWIVNENYQFYGMIFTIIGAIANVGLNYILIPTYGIMGAAWATVISQGLSAWFLAVLFNKTRVAFKMHTKAIMKSLLILPVIKSVQQVLKEAKT